MTETTNPASRAMDTFHAAMVIYSTGLVQVFSCGTTLKEYVITNPLPVIQHIYDVKENFSNFLKIALDLL